MLSNAVSISEGEMRYGIKTLTASVLIVAAVSLNSCGARADLHRNYDRASFLGEWSAQEAVILNPKYQGREVRIRVERYGKIICRINSDSTYALDVSLERDVVLDDGETWISKDRVLVHGGRKYFTTGSYSYDDSVADFYDYNRKNHFRSVLYTCRGHFFITYTDEARNEWRLDCERED